MTTRAYARGTNFVFLGNSTLLVHIKNHSRTRDEISIATLCN